MAKKPEGTNFDQLLEELNGAKKGGAGSEAAAPVQKKSGFVTLIGRPNVGKSGTDYFPRYAGHPQSKK